AVPTGPTRCSTPSWRPPSTTRKRASPQAKTRTISRRNSRLPSQTRNYSQQVALVQSATCTPCFRCRQRVNSGCGSRSIHRRSQLLAHNHIGTPDVGEIVAREQNLPVTFAVEVETRSLGVKRREDGRAVRQPLQQGVVQLPAKPQALVGGAHRQL